MTTLRKKINHEFSASVFDKGSDRDFLPDGSIEGLVNKKSVKKALGGKGKITYDDQNKSTELLIEFILEKARKVFAITALVLPLQDLRAAIEALQKVEICDSDLPLDKLKMGDKVISSNEHSRIGDNSASESSSDKDESITEIWDDLTVKEFCLTQWQVLTPVFDRSQFIHDLKKDSILPFIRKLGQCDTGSSGIVSMFEIHHKHLVDIQNPVFRSPDPVKIYIAVKEVQPKTKQERKRIFNTWGQEARALQKLNQLHQPHIVQFHTSFRRGTLGAQDHYLMLECADGGNLRNLWKTFPRPALTMDLIKATTGQLLGLAKAINKAHYPETGPNFRHGDLKPENILWFKDKKGDGIGTLKIGDWGTAKQHYRVTEMRSNRTTTKWGTRRYEPPEEVCSQGTGLQIPGQSGKKRSRLYDMWALGCIMLEFLIWLVYGHEELDRFNQGIMIDNADNTRFYLIKQDSNGKLVATVHDVVAKWMEHMAQDPICRFGSTALGSLLEIVQTRLLVVKLPERLGTTISPFENTTTSRDAKFNDDSSRFQPSEAGPEGNRVIQTFKIDEAEPSKPSVSQKAQLDPDPKGPGRRGWERARAFELLDRLLEICVEDDNEEAYWFTGQPNPRRGPDVDQIRQNIPPQALFAEITGRVVRFYAGGSL